MFFGRRRGDRRFLERDSYSLGTGILFSCASSMAASRQIGSGTIESLIRMSAPRNLSGYLKRSIWTRINERRDRGFLRQWYLLHGFRDKSCLLNPEPDKLDKLIPPNDRSWMDPFAWRHGDDYYIFCEEWVFGDPHAHISVLHLDERGQMKTEVKPVIREPYHLAYPFLFEFDGLLYLVPDGRASGKIDVYRCETFPHQWVKAKTLMNGVEAVDSTLVEHNQKWWLFTSLQRHFYKLWHALFAFHADSPLAEHWTPHPRNPVVCGFDRARPAGRIFVLGEKLYRPSQNNVKRYGDTLNINEIVRLDAEDFQERVVNRVVPNPGVGRVASHHLDWNGGMLVMDAQRLLPA
jgi:hypothetical protein